MATTTAASSSPFYHQYPNHPHVKKRSKRYYVSKFVYFVGAFLVTCCIISFTFTMIHISNFDSPAEQFAQKHLQNLAIIDTTANAAHVQNLLLQKQKEKDATTNKNKNYNVDIIAANHQNVIHPVAGLDCQEHGGPNSSQETKEMVYWKDIPYDNNWKSPFLTPGVRRYLTFEPDGGGWNNIRMSMETVLTMALAMGRVLVLPPSQKMYLLGKTNFNFADFFPLQEIAQEHDGLEIITTDQFLLETMGKLKETSTNQIIYPPNNKTMWDGDTTAVKYTLNPFLQSIAINPDWDPGQCIAAFPQSSDPEDIQELQQTFDDLIADPENTAADAYKEYLNHPSPIDASMKERLKEFLAERTKLCLYDGTLQSAPIIHFHGKAKKEIGGRLLVHFYAFLFFQNYHHDLFMKRFIRDHVRYIDNIQCAAARIVSAIRSTKLQPNDQGEYDSFHIRRGDFQYKKTRVSAEELVAAAEAEIPKGRTVYIGTDERRKDFFQPLKDHGWNVLFLDDFQDLLGDINPHYYGMIDQLVASRGKTFFGCWFSTFTGYIDRLRGYHSQNVLNGRDAEAYQQGRLPHSYYYALLEHKSKMHDYWPVKKLFYAREYPTSWRQLDFDVNR